MASPEEAAQAEALVDGVLRLCDKKPVWMVLIAVGEVLGRAMASTPDEGLVEETLASKNPMYGFLDRKEVLRVIDNFYSGKDANAYYKVWSLLSLALWFEYHAPSIVIANE